MIFDSYFDSYRGIVTLIRVVNGSVKVGDKITIEYLNRSVIAQVEKIPTGNVAVQEAKDLYTLIEEIIH